MKAKKLLERLGEFLSAEKRAQHEQSESIQKVLKKLKKKERNLKEKLDAETDTEHRHKLAAQLEIIFAQRKKGVKLLRELRGK